MEQEEELEKLRREKLQREEIELYKLSIVKEEDKRKIKGMMKFHTILLTIFHNNLILKTIMQNL